MKDSIESTVVKLFEQSISQERDAFSGYDSIALYFGRTVPEAWMEARPEAETAIRNTLSHPEFAQMLQNANGMWLRPRHEKGYAVLIKMEKRSVQEMANVLKEGVQCCLDHQRFCRGSRNVRGKQSLLY